MRANPTVTTTPNQSFIERKKKERLGGLMDPEEARMNRALLQEIARAKRGEEPTPLLAHQRDAPI